MHAQGTIGILLLSSKSCLPQVPASIGLLANTLGLLMLRGLVAHEAVRLTHVRSGPWVLQKPLIIRKIMVHAFKHLDSWILSCGVGTFVNQSRPCVRWWSRSKLYIALRFRGCCFELRLGHRSLKNINKLVVFLCVFLSCCFPVRFAILHHVRAS